jgi:alpha-2-macroglobulin-like protein
MTSMGRFSKFNYLLSAAAIGGFFFATRFILGVQAPQVGFNIAGSEPYLMHAATDKPIYRTGEKIYVRGVLLRADSHSPTATAGTAQFQIKGPRGDIVASASAPIIDSVVGFTWDVPESQAGGEYTVAIRHPFGDAAAERKFDIRAYRAPRLKSQIVFVRDGYGPGDTVAANLHVERAEGGVPAGAVVSVIARVDGAEAWKGETRVDASGNANARFKLPSEIARGEGVLAMVIQDGGIVETASKTIPILLQTIDLSTYPEGGDLIAGLPNRVYLEGRTPAQKPADMAGIVVNASGKEVARFRTEHEGRGRFSFVPIRGESYSLRVIEPSGIKTVFRLPEVKATGAVLSSISDVTPRGEDVLLRIAATAEGTYGIALTQRGKEISFKSVALRAGLPAELSFTVPRDRVATSLKPCTGMPASRRMPPPVSAQSRSISVIR